MILCPLRKVCIVSLRSNLTLVASPGLIGVGFSNEFLNFARKISLRTIIWKFAIDSEVAPAVVSVESVGYSSITLTTKSQSVPVVLIHKSAEIFPTIWTSVLRGSERYVSTSFRLEANS